MATVGDRYSQQLTASGGSGSGYSFTTGSTLPTGLTLTTLGLLSGTPSSTTGSPFTVVVTVTDSNDATGSQSYTVTVNPAIMLSPSTLPTPTVGNFYSQQLTASGGSGSGYVFTSGTLPPGLTLSASGLLSGTPTTVSGVVFTVDVTVTDGDGGTGSMNYVLTVKELSEAGGIVSSLPQTFYGENVVLTATFTATRRHGPDDRHRRLLRRHDLSGHRAADRRGRSQGTASLPTSALTVGNHVIQAIYSGDVNYSGATSETPVSVLVVPATTSTTLTSRPRPRERSSPPTSS